MDVNEAFQYVRVVNKMMKLMNIDKKGDAAATNWGTKNATKWIEQAKQREEEGWISYLSGLAVAFRQESYSDIQVKPGNGPAIPAHRFLLAASSEASKTMLASDLCKSAPIDSVSLLNSSMMSLRHSWSFFTVGNCPRKVLEAFLLPPTCS
ncbi:BTB/POZ domain-containing protein At3g56230-like [Papaver somniferum]|uniref:BTB/POZ domain-containing protein At3g56230-like n=1 Tax=Papaver somniferum TaxID=3469 RepID=UPI000E702967|nr:BTB/POZ domain-containing protein At3g56230-like [Papaver somniferum]